MNFDMGGIIASNKKSPSSLHSTLWARTRSLLFKQANRYHLFLPHITKQIFEHGHGDG